MLKPRGATSSVGSNNSVPVPVFWMVNVLVRGSEIGVAPKSTLVEPLTIDVEPSRTLIAGAVTLPWSVSENRL